MYTLPPPLRAELARPLGPVLTTEEVLKRLQGAGKIVTVGDVVTRTLLDNGVTPNVMVIDFKTQRREDLALAERLREMRVPVIALENPAGTIGLHLWEALLAALQATVPVVIHVTEGEEDLAVVPALLLAPAGSAILYGQPPVTDLGIHEGGVVLVQVTPESRKTAHHILHRMEVT